MCSLSTTRFGANGEPQVCAAVRGLAPADGVLRCVGLHRESCPDLGDGELERRSLADCAFERKAGAVLLCNPFAQRKAQARASRGSARPINTVEAIKDSRLMFGGDT